MPLGACSVSRRDKHPTLNPYSQHEHLTQRQRQPAEARRPTTERRKTSRLPSPVLQLPPSDRRCAVTSFTMSNNPTTETGTQRTQRPIPSNHRHPKTLAPRADAQDRKIRCPGSLRDPMPAISRYPTAIFRPPSAAARLVEASGFEPPTPCLQSKCSPN